MLLFQSGALLFLALTAFGQNYINQDAAKELKCFIPETVPVSLEWVFSNELYYHPYLSRLEFYKASVELAGRPRSHDESLVEACLVNSVIQGWLNIDLQWGAFGRYKNKVFKVVPVKGGLEHFEFESDTGKYSGTSYTVLTDNKTYFLLVSCISGEMTWSVTSVTKTLPEDTLNEIYSKVKELGFKEEFFITIDYEKCNFNKWMGKKPEL